MAGFCEPAISLRAPKPADVGAKSLIVSGRYLKYSRFRETPAGDRVRSALRGRWGSLLVEQIPLSAKTGRGFEFEGSRMLLPGHSGVSRSRCAEKPSSPLIGIAGEFNCLWQRLHIGRWIRVLYDNHLLIIVDTLKIMVEPLLKVRMAQIIILTVRLFVRQQR